MTPPFRRIRDRAGFLLLGALLALAPSARADEGVGQRVLGTLGLDAGSQGDPGLYVGNRFLFYTANRLLGRHGEVLPVKGLDVSTWADVLGLAGTFKIGGGAHGPYYTAAFGVPVAGIRVRSELPRNSVDTSGLADIVLMPAKLGWRLPHLDLVTSYGLYAPTSQINRDGVSQSQWAHQLSAGGTVYFDDDRSWRLSALASWNIHERKPRIDITRGQTVQVQGGFGGRVAKLFDVGVAAYALWQVTADGGSELPTQLTGIREYGVGLGPEVGMLLPWIRGKLTARYEWQVDGHSRLDGQILLVSLNMLAWRPES